jgi:O-antigen ligase
MVRGLLFSYSRGAWLAFFCGFGYLAWRAVQSPPVLHSGSATEGGKSKVQSHWISSFAKNWLPLSVILASAFVLTFWQFRHAEHKLAHRTFSVSNVNDFSVRNRVATWEGALQMMADRPWFGLGWNQPEPMYGNDYSPPKLVESAAIEMNDYFMLGATLGIPALFCFIAYIWLSLTRSAECGMRNGGQNSETRIHPASSPSILHPPSSILLAATCRAGAIVLLVGFWFDGGLFKLPTAATFWILLELGAAPARNRDAV